MRARIGNNVSISGPTDDVLRWCKKNLVVNNPEYEKKRRLGLWLGNTPKELKLYQLKPNEIIIPYGAWIDGLAKEFAFVNIKSNFANNAQVNYNADIPLYDYQTEAVNELVSNGHGILQSKAGSGKTRCGIATIARTGKKALWLTHTNELLNQSYKAASDFIDKSKLGKISGGKVQIGEAITFATVQTMSKLDLLDYRYEWDVVLVDECHRVAGTPTKATMFSKVLNNLACEHKYGLSATLHRSDGLIKCCFAMLGSVAHTVPDDVVNVMDVRISKQTTETMISEECLDTDGTLVYSKLISYLASDPKRNAQIAKDLYMHSGNSNLLLSDRVAHLEIIYNLLPDMIREKAVILHGKVKKSDREKALDDMRTGKKKYLLATYALAKEGLDVPCLDRLYLATPVKDYAIVVQSVGRIARVCDGKADPVVFDYVDSRIGFLEKMWKKRCTSYRKAGCIL